MDTNNAFGPLGGGGAAFNVTAFGHGGDDFIFAHSASQGHHQFFGGSDADFLQGNAGDDILLGGADHDELIGDDLQVGVIQEGAA